MWRRSIWPISCTHGLANDRSVLRSFGSEKRCLRRQAELNTLIRIEEIVKKAVAGQGLTKMDADRAHLAVINAHTTCLPASWPWPPPRHGARYWVGPHRTPISRWKER